MELSALLGLWMYICVQGNWVQAKAKEVVDTGLKFEVPLQGKGSAKVVIPMDDFSTSMRLSVAPGSEFVYDGTNGAAALGVYGHKVSGKRIAMKSNKWYVFYKYHKAAGAKAKGKKTSLLVGPASTMTKTEAYLAADDVLKKMLDTKHQTGQAKASGRRKRASELAP